MGLLRAVRPWTQWIAGWGFDINKGDPDLSEKNVREKIRILIGDPAIEPDIVRTSVWYINQAYVTQYSKGRVLCGGDAVHRHPPSSGLGNNTCVQDGHNLGWKLAFAVKGWAGPKLLDSYSQERAPVGKQVVQRATERLFSCAGRRKSRGGGDLALPRSGAGRSRRPQGCPGGAGPQTD